MLNSARRGISYPNPDRSDRPDPAAHIKNLVDALEVDVIYVQGTDAARLARAHQANGGLFFWTTDTKAAWYDDGAAWWQIGPGMQINTYGNRPAAGAVPPGTRFLASDTLGYWYSDGVTWTLISNGLPIVSMAAFALAPWTTPYDGMRAALTIDATNAVYWNFRYNSGSASAYKWEFQGGPPLSAEVTTSESTTNGAYGALGTAGPILAVPRPGDYYVTAGAAIGSGAGGGSTGGVMSYDIGATTSVDADGAKGLLGAVSAGPVSAFKKRLKTALTAVNLTSKYKTGGGGSATFDGRYLEIVPVRIS